MPGHLLSLADLGRQFGIDSYCLRIESQTNERTNERMIATHFVDADNAMSLDYLPGNIFPRSCFRARFPIVARFSMHSRFADSHVAARARPKARTLFAAAAADDECIFLVSFFDSNISLE